MRVRHCAGDCPPLGPVTVKPWTVRPFGIGTLTRALSNAVQQAAKSAKGARAAGPRRRRALTAKDRARLKLQGEYLGLMRHLPKSHHKRVKALRAKRGYPPAIKLARRLMK